MGIRGSVFFEGVISYFPSGQISIPLLNPLMLPSISIRQSGDPVVFIGRQTGKIPSENYDRLLSEIKTLNAWHNFLQGKRKHSVSRRGGVLYPFYSLQVEDRPSNKQPSLCFFSDAPPCRESEYRFVAYIYFVLAAIASLSATTLLISGQAFTQVYYCQSTEHRLLACAAFLYKLANDRGRQNPVLFLAGFFLLRLYPFLAFLCHVYVPKRGSSAPICCIVTYLSVF